MTPPRPPDQLRPAIAGDGALSTQQRAARVALISAANEQMQVAGRAAFAAYERVHTADHVIRCPERCREAHSELLRRLADINAEYQAGIDEGQP